MTNNTQITGITISEDTENGVYICYIDNFSDDLKNKIREMLSSIWHGAVDSEERQQFNYKNTLKRFLERYNPKTPDTKKGMMGELLSHLLIPQYISLKAISIMKNKEENSIRKGFDIVYSNQENLPFPNFSVDVSEQNPESSKDEIFSTIPNYSTGEKITVSGYPGVKISSDFGQTQIFVLKKKNLYILTLTFPKEQENDFFETKNLIINSFNLI